MDKFGKWITGGLGWALFGPIGGIVGFVVGSLFDKSQQLQVSSGNQQRYQTTQGGYVMSLLVLVAAVMKADTKILKSELEYTKQFFVRSFGAASAGEAIKILRDLLNQNIPVTEVCHQIRKNMDHPSRLQLVHFLFGIADADGHVHESEHKLIGHIAQHMGISEKDYQSIEAMFVANTDAAYKILEVEATATDDELKKAYRKMAVKYHPDKVHYLGEDIQKAAHEKFQKVNEAWETVKKQRGIV
ncbi:MAG: TerB family tellurite resistance protein [Bacteroidota bacterium]|nr:TerB family tellurite resistance protein [Bacteroidota bacterium]MDP3433258.1 TerB family tellurite resistance protein [Bacteroidota bacterium]